MNCIVSVDQNLTQAPHPEGTILAAHGFILPVVDGVVNNAHNGRAVCGLPRWNSVYQRRARQTDQLGLCRRESRLILPVPQLAERS